MVAGHQASQAGVLPEPLFRLQRDVGVIGNDLLDDVEEGRPFPPFQRIQIGADALNIEAFGLVELRLIPAARGIAAQILPVALHLPPDQHHRGITLQRSVTAIKHIIQRIEAVAQLPIFTGHEDPVYFYIEGCNVTDMRPFDDDAGAVIPIVIPIVW